ncbi:MAG: hypothetical protein JO006_03795 [Paucibacter sp.]|nr:hypothetical protein [Roseateles sp.]
MRRPLLITLVAAALFLLLAVLLPAEWRERAGQAVMATAARWAGTPTWVWCATLLGLWACYLSRAARIWFEWRRETGLPFSQLLWLSLQHNAAVYLLPMRAGELSFPLLMKRHAGVSLADAALSLVALRAQDATVVAALSLSVIWPCVPSVLASLGLIVTAAWLFRRLRGWQPQGARLQRLAAALRRSRTDWLGWCLSLLMWSVKLALIALLLVQLGGLGEHAAFCGALGGEFAAALPVQGPASLGNYEASVVAGVWVSHAQGEPPIEQIAAAALAVHLVFFAIACAAGAMAWIAMPRPVGELA